MSDDREPDDGFPDFDELIGTFMKETTLWPVLVVVLGSLGAFGGALIVLVGVDHNPFAAAALVLLLGMTIDVVVRARRRGVLRNLARLVGLVWAVAFAFAGLAVWSGIAY
jgi:hypothetical protein